MSKDTNTVEKRDGFQSKWGFILACIGSAVGMGNIWRFPIMVQQYGGMTFLLPYFLFVILIGSSGVIEEFALGRRAKAGPVGAFGMCTKERTGSDKAGKAFGAIPIIGALMLAIGYTVVLGWIFKYTFLSISGGLYSLGTDMGAIGGTFGVTAPEAETLGEALKAMASAGFFGIGNGVWQIVALVVSLAIMVMGIAGGIEKANKIMMPVLFGLFLVLAVYIATLPGAQEGYKYILKINPAGLADPKVWVFAFGQAFFSLSVAGNGSVIYGSYLPEGEDIPELRSQRSSLRHHRSAARSTRYRSVDGSGSRRWHQRRSWRPRPDVRLPRKRIQRNARRPYHRRGILHLRSVCRRLLDRQPV